jgi:hypothetical protein
MTDSDDPIDDLASAHLDGATTPKEDAALAGDPVVLARLEALRSARDRVRAAAGHDAVDPDRREAAVAAALRAFDAAQSEGAAGDGAVVPLATRPARPVARGRWRAIGIAAAVALVALAVPLLGQLGSDGDDDLASSDAPAQSTTSAAAEEAAAGAAGPTADAAFDAPASSAPLGSFGTVEDLAAAVQDALVPRTAAASESALAAGDDASRPQPCAAAVEDRADGRGRAYQGYASLDDRTVVVVVFEDAAGDRTLVLLDADDCAEVTSRPL